MRLAALLAFVFAAASMASADTISAARYTDPTGRYPHGVLGDQIEWGALELTLNGGSTRRIELPVEQVFEDLEPRLADVDQDGEFEVVVVESHFRLGARLAIYDENGFVTATPPIGTRFRWLAPIGIGDLDQDGEIELAYIDRPHLAKTLRVWRYEDGELYQVANERGLTNHRIGEDFISGGVRDCGDGPEMIVASHNWRMVMSVRLRSDALASAPIGAFDGPASFEAALACR